MSPCWCSTTLAVSSRAVGDFGVEDVGQGFEQRVCSRSASRRSRFERRHLVAQRHGLGLQRRGVAALALGHADLARDRVAARLRCPAARSARRGARSSQRQDAPPTRAPAPAAPAPRRTPPDRRGSPGCHASRVRVSFVSSGLASRLLRRHPARREDRDLVEQDQRHREADLADDVGRRDDRRHHEHADDRVAPPLAQRLDVQDADLAPAASAAPASGTRCRRPGSCA